MLGDLDRQVLAQVLAIYTAIYWGGDIFWLASRTSTNRIVRYSRKIHFITYATLKQARSLLSPVFLVQYLLQQRADRLADYIPSIDRGLAILTNSMLSRIY